MKAFIVLSEEYRVKYANASEKELDELRLDIQTFFKGYTAPYKVPREVSPEF